MNMNTVFCKKCGHSYFRIYCEDGEYLVKCHAGHIWEIPQLLTAEEIKCQKRRDKE